MRHAKQTGKQRHFRLRERREGMAVGDTRGAFEGCVEGVAATEKELRKEARMAKWLELWLDSTKEWQWETPQEQWKDGAKLSCEIETRIKRGRIDLVGWVGRKVGAVAPGRLHPGGCTRAKMRKISFFISFVMLHGCNITEIFFDHSI